MNIVESLHAFLLDCPLMDGLRVNVDYLPADAKDGVEFSVDATPAAEVVTQYLDGGAECQHTFVLRSVNDYGPDVLQNLSNCGFYEDFAAWMRQKTRKRALPALPEGCVPKRIEAQSTGYLFSAGADSGQYQIQCRILYFRKGDRGT